MHPYPTGPTPAGLVKRLLKLARKPVQLTRGRHVCELCRERRDPIRMQRGLRPVWLGNGEIRVTGENGEVYAAPTMIAHYVAEHGYLPPRASVDAVLCSVTRGDAKLRDDACARATTVYELGHARAHQPCRTRSSTARVGRVSGGRDPPGGLSGPARRRCRVRQLYDRHQDPTHAIAGALTVAHRAAAASTSVIACAGCGRA